MRKLYLVNLTRGSGWPGTTGLCIAANHLNNGKDICLFTASDNNDLCAMAEKR